MEIKLKIRRGLKGTKKKKRFKKTESSQIESSQEKKVLNHNF
jgi:hypothetical protein